MVDLTAAALRSLRLYGPIALLLFTFLETSLLFPFLPSEVVVPAAAALLVTDPLSFAVFVITAGVGGTVGALVPYYVFRDTRVGRADWLSGYIRISEARIGRGQEWFHKWGRSSVLWGRFLPFLRSAVSIPAGFSDMHPLRFGAYTATGIVMFYAGTGALVYYARRQSLFEAALAVALARPIAVVGGVAALGVVGLAAWQLGDA